MGLIEIKKMEFYSHHGCFNEEQIIGNKFIVDFYFETDTTKSEKTDNLTETIDYQAVYMLIKKEMEIKSKLLEHVARRILNAVCNNFPMIEEAKVKISKINPPIGGKVQKVSVVLSTRDKR
jgi:dihydroneopterin aldolase